MPAPATLRQSDSAAITDPTDQDGGPLWYTPNADYRPEQLKYGTPEHDRFVRDLDERERYLRRTLEPSWDDMIRWWRLYNAQIEDHRGPDEDWRAAVHVPYPYSGIETRVAALIDILNSTDPPMQCGPVGSNDIEIAKGAESLLATTFDLNNWRFFMDNVLRERCIQGTALFRVAFRMEYADVHMSPLPSDIYAYQSKMAGTIAEALRMGYPPPPPPDETQQFNAWMDMLAQKGMEIPASPFDQRVRTRTYNAPRFERLSLFDCRYDPMVENIQDQSLFMIRSVRTGQWLKRNTGPGPDKMFDPAAVQEGMRMRGDDQSKYRSQDKEIAHTLNVSPTGVVGSDPYYRNGHELWECFLPGEEVAYVVVLNKKIIINKDFRMPYGHGQIPIIHMRNTPVGGYFHGISELQQTERLYYELNSHRNLLLDATTLQTIPIFAKVNAFGLPISQFQIKPGAMWDLPRPDAIAPVIKAMPLADAWQLFASLKQDIDETNSTPTQLRGGPATVGRVSATESERRFSQALSRVKQDAIRIEEESVPLGKQTLFLWYQFTDQESRAARGIAPELANDGLLRAMDYDLRFRGPTRSLNRDVLVEQMMTWANTFGALLPPHRSIRMAKRIFEEMGLKGVEEIVPEEDIAYAEAQFEAQQAAPPPPEEGGPAGAGPPPPGGQPAPLMDQGAPPIPGPEVVNPNVETVPPPGGMV